MPVMALKVPVPNLQKGSARPQSEWARRTSAAVTGTRGNQNGFNLHVSPSLLYFMIMVCFSDLLIPKNKNTQ